MEFDPDGKLYEYKSPVMLRKGDIVLVNVFGCIKAAKVRKRFKKQQYHAERIKEIVGIGCMLCELQTDPVEQPTKTKTLIDKIWDVI